MLSINRNCVCFFISYFIWYPSYRLLNAECWPKHPWPFQNHSQSAEHYTNSVWCLLLFVVTEIKRVALNHNYVVLPQSQVSLHGVRIVPVVCNKSHACIRFFMDMCVCIYSYNKCTHFFMLLYSAYRLIFFLYIICNKSVPSHGLCRPVCP